jgi:DNA processing protein
VGALPLAEQKSLEFNDVTGAMPDEQTLDDAREQVIAALGASPTLLDDVLVMTGLTPHLLMAVLLELELAGRLERHPGSKVALRMEPIVSQIF